MRVPIYIVLCLLILVFVQPGSLHANTETPATICSVGSPHAYVGLVAGGHLCAIDLVLQTPQWVDVVVWSRSLQSVRFSLPALPTGAVFLQSDFYYPTTGDLFTGIEFDFGGCENATGTVFIIGRVQLIALSAFPCAEWRAAPHGGTGQIEITDCDGNVQRGASLRNDIHTGVLGPACTCNEIHCNGLAPLAENSNPSDGATGVPTGMTLFWDPGFLGAWFAAQTTIRVGTDPNCDSWDMTFTLPGIASVTPNLAPNTTYYWKAEYWDGFHCYAESQVNSFTTGAAISVWESTWGKIKGVFR